MAMIDDQFERCKAALIRLEQSLPKVYDGDFTVPIAAHEIDDLDVFLQNAGNMMSVARNLHKLHAEALGRLDKALAVLQRHPAALAEYQAATATAEQQPQQRLVDFITAQKACDKSIARRLIGEGRVLVNLKRVDDITTQVWPGDLVEIFNETRQICSAHRVD